MKELKCQNLSAPISKNLDIIHIVYFLVNFQVTEFTKIQNMV